MLFAECGLRQCNRDPAVGHVASRVNQFALSQLGQQSMKVGLSVKIERWRLTPDATEHHLGVLR